MALAQQLGHRPIRNTALPYDSFGSPIKASPVWIQGSNILTSIRTYLEKRPGFAAYETTPTIFSETLTRLFSWHTWDDRFIVMLSTHATTTHKVYKYEVGVDSSFVDLAITNNGTSSSPEPVDFVVSNNTVFMSSKDGLISHKWDTQTVSKWGIAIGEGTSSGPLTAGLGVNTITAGVSWTNPNNVTSAVNYTTVLLIYGSSESKVLSATNFGFAIPAGAQITGIKMSFEAYSDALPHYVSFALEKSGFKATPYQKTTVYSGGVHTYSFGNSSELWGTNWTVTDINSTGFGVAIKAGPGPYVGTNYLRNVQLTVYYIPKPTATVSGTAGTFSAIYGYRYVYCYGNADTGGVSSPSTPTDSTGAFSSKLNVGVAVQASADPQVNQIRLFRTTDGGGGIYFEVADSPYANTTATITDDTADADLSTISAPISGYNDPPPVGLHGMTWFQNRIWGLLPNSSQIAFSGWEEINIGYEEECFPSGFAGNTTAMDDVGKALACTTDVLLGFTPTSINKVEGDSLDTFRRSFLAVGMGCRSRTNIASTGKIIAWVNTDNTIWITDGTSLTSISNPIRDDIAALDQLQSALLFYNQDVNHWLVLFDGANSKVYIYDLDTQQWMLPWNLATTVAANSLYGTVCAFGEVAAGSNKLFLANTTKVLALTPGAYTDDGTTYTGFVASNLFDLVPGGFEVYTGGYGFGAPAGHLGSVDYMSIETNLVMPATVRIMVDDHPIVGLYGEPIMPVDPEKRLDQANNLGLIEKWYRQRFPAARRASFRIDWAAGSVNFKLYSADLAYLHMTK